jgi:Fic family protein
MKQLTTRQTQIYAYILSQGSATNQDLIGHFSGLGTPVSRVTIVRDLDALLKQRLIKKVGQGRSVTYTSVTTTSLLRPFPENYFDIDVDLRAIQDRFNAQILAEWQPIFSANELKTLEALTQTYQKNRSELSTAQYRKEVERLTIELSWKSSQIEGNTYSLLDTESLLQNHHFAKGHTKEEAIMLLNHKTALDYIFGHPTLFEQVTFRKIEDIHRLLVTDLQVDLGIRSRLVRITGTRYAPLDNTFQIRENLEAACALINRLSDPFNKALAAVLLISYIQPFEDGNKRTARLISDAILLAHHACPLSYRSVDVTAYKKAILLFYEQNSVLFFKTLFMEQYRFAVKTYFSSH